MTRIAYLLITDTPLTTYGDGPIPEGNLYTRDVLKGTLQLLGCKPRHAYRLSDLVFLKVEEHMFGADRRRARSLWRLHPRGTGSFWLSMPRSAFTRIVMESLAGVVYKGSLADDLKVATSLSEKRRSVTVLLCGTSGTGKSTLASLLATRLNITTVISTDSIRQMMRNFSTPQDDPLLFASTYQTADSFDGKRTVGLEGLSETKRALKGYKAQSEMVMENLERLITQSENRRESMVVEGVHLSLNFVVRLMKTHSSVVPFLVFISNEMKHRERFAVRSKYMTTDPTRNRYVKHMKNIRTIQDYLTKKADKHLIPKVDNTNVDRSVALIHSTIFGCVKRMTKGDAMLDVGTNTVKVVHAEFLSVRDGMTWRGKDILEVIRSKSLECECLPSTSNSTFSVPSMEDAGKDRSDDSYAVSSEERVMSSDPDDEPGSDWENSSNEGCHGAAEHNTECGSVWESTDMEDHED